MKAIVYTRYGSPDILHLEEVPKPEPGDGEVRVRVHATTVNDIDWSFLRGRPRIYRLMSGLARPRFPVLGAEVAGTVDAMGPGATKFAPGDAVYGDISEAGLGGFAEYVCVREGALVRKPESMSFEQAAALPHAGMLAYQGLVELGRIRRGERVLINGAGGGVGTLGVQMAKTYDAEVTGVDRASKLDALRRIGFDHLLDYRQVDFTRTGDRYDLILDAKTTRSPRSYLCALNPGGRYVTVGGNLPRLLQILGARPYVGGLTDREMRIVALKPNRDLAYVNERFEAGALAPVIDGPYPLADLPEAMRRFGKAEHVGKIVIRLSEEESRG